MFSANTSQVSADQVYVEDVFSTYLYTGTSGAQTITNGIDLAGKGGLVWQKRRDAATDHYLFDTARGGIVSLASNSTSTGTNWGDYGLTYNSNGFTILSGFSTSATFASWTFREAPKFFDVVTYTGNGSTQSISHNLGTAPGTIIVKSYGAGGSWIVYHQSLGAGSRLFLNATNAAATTVPETIWGNNTTTVAPTSTAFTTGSALNVNGDTYVAYLFAHDTTSDGIIQCGSFTTDGTGAATVNLGWEPQWLLCKTADVGGSWFIQDNMRGFGVSGGPQLNPNTTSAENPLSLITANATGFSSNGWGASYTFVYIAIRRGPMRTPTSGASVFAPIAVTASAGTSRTVGFASDFVYAKYLDGSDSVVTDRLRGFLNSNTIASPSLFTNTTGAENSSNYPLAYNVWNTTAVDGTYMGTLRTVFYHFRRAPSFFDGVCYTGTGSARTVNHNLGVAPELMIVKRRDSTGNWFVYNQTITPTYALLLNDSQPRFTNTPSNVYWNDTAPTANVFSVGSSVAANGSGATYVAYLFASCPGVSKVGSYTGNGSSQTINCGFAAGARFVMIKRTDSTGDWYVWDSARGIVAGNDPRLSLNSTAAEVTTDDSVDTDSSGFVVNQLSATNINVSSATYIYLAVA